jgi:hypothetical protein
MGEATAYGFDGIGRQGTSLGVPDDSLTVSVAARRPQL